LEFNEHYENLLRETLLKKGHPSNSLPKTFILIFITGINPCYENSKLKVFGKGSGE
jgi:hypothetical protein